MNFLGQDHVPTCDECNEGYTTTYGESATYNLCTDCYEEAIKEGKILLYTTFIQPHKGDQLVPTSVNIIKKSYDYGICPDCSEDIPNDVDTGDACSSCGHAFYASVDWRHDAYKGKTEEVCNDCGSTNIGYSAWVKRIDGIVEIVGGPFDESQCLNERCEKNSPNVRDVLVKDLKDCDGKDCYYNGDKSVMKEVRATVLKESYWYCSNCVVDVVVDVV